jgi:hypothetical protein
MRESFLVLPPQQALQQAQAQEKERQDTFKRAFSTCLESEGYTVKQAGAGLFIPGSGAFPN